MLPTLLCLAMLVCTCMLVALHTPQVRTLREPRTGTRVVLVGVMHHNPASVALSRAITERERCRDGARLHTILVESCSARWNATLALGPRWNSLVADEMLAAAEACTERGPRLELADQPIARTFRRAKILRTQTLRELATPWSGGWQSVWADVRDGARDVSGHGETGAIGLADVLEPRLVLGMPVGWARYLLSLATRGPFVFRAVIGLVALVGLLGASGDGMCDMTAPPETWRWCVAMVEDSSSVAAPGAAVEAGAPALLQVLDVSAVLDCALLVAAAVITRVGLVGFVEERNFVLARSIRAACVRGKHSRSGPMPTVVAVMGLAHVNGVLALLRRPFDVEMVGELMAQAKPAAERRAKRRGARGESESDSEVQEEAQHEAQAEVCIEWPAESGSVRR